ncbi:thioredoxin family protein [uncultured Tateyamaria sp.]|uniref:thioredoxin family protein n=1 Tax=uncultured Tateyamaria sp. TaxID=455651 RepID=UPI00260E00A9|nr:thioredoxin family protein [uncultured Tateyamaria sp.]
MLLDTPTPDFGAPAPHFRLPDANGVQHDLNDHLGDKGLLIAFICNHCPYVIAIAERLAADAKCLERDGVGVLAIMSNDYDSYPADAPDKMIAFADKYGFDFPYLVDADQSVARAYGAVCTPDFFGFDGTGRLQYRGRLDDARMGDATQRTPELLIAMRMIADTGLGPSDQMPSMGCSIKWR